MSDAIHKLGDKKVRGKPAGVIWWVIVLAGPVPKMRAPTATILGSRDTLQKVAITDVDKWIP